MILILQSILKICLLLWFSYLLNDVSCRIHDIQRYQQLLGLSENCTILQVNSIWAIFCCNLEFACVIAVCVTHLFRHLLTIDVKRLLCMTVQKRGYVDLQGTAKEDNFSCCYGTTLQKDPTCTLPCSWTSTDPSTFLIRGKNYLQDRQKVVTSTISNVNGASIKGLLVCSTFCSFECSLLLMVI